MKELLIRVECFDGEIGFYRPSEGLCYGPDILSVKVDRFALARKFYPEYRVQDLYVQLGFFEVPESVEVI